jgi:hypothetical protein
MIPDPGRGVGEDSSVGLEGVVQLADSLKNATSGPQSGSGWLGRFAGGEQVGVLRDEDLDEEEERRVEERNGLRKR